MGAGSEAWNKEVEEGNIDDVGIYIVDSVVVEGQKKQGEAGKLLQEEFEGIVSTRIAAADSYNKKGFVDWEEKPEGAEGIAWNALTVVDTRLKVGGIEAAGSKVENKNSD